MRRNEEVSVGKQTGRPTDLLTNILTDKKHMKKLKDTNI